MVETVITLEVPLTVLVASRAFSARIGLREWSGILVMTAGMISVVAVLNPRPGSEIGVAHTISALAGGGTAATVAALVLAARRGRRIWRTACLGAATGTSFGLIATLIKETVAQLSDRGIFGVMSTWQTYAAIGFGVLGIVLMQAALHLGPLLAAQPGFTFSGAGYTRLGTGGCRLRLRCPGSSRRVVRPDASEPARREPGRGRSTQPGSRRTSRPAFAAGEQALRARHA